MARVVSIHRYLLREGFGPEALVDAATRAEGRGLFELPGLDDYVFLEGMKGGQRGRCAALWIYGSEEAWKALWGPSSDPKPKSQYPEKWIIWEDQLLAPILAEDPDRIGFTSYRELLSEQL